MDHREQLPLQSDTAFGHGQSNTDRVLYEALPRIGHRYDRHKSGRAEQFGHTV